MRKEIGEHIFSIVLPLFLEKETYGQKVRGTNNSYTLALFVRPAT